MVLIINFMLFLIIQKDCFLIFFICDLLSKSGVSQ